VPSGGLSRFLRRLFVFLFSVSALAIGGYGILLVVESFTEHGSPGGNAFVFMIGLFCLCVSAVVLIICAMKWREGEDMGRQRIK